MKTVILSRDFGQYGAGDHVSFDDGEATSLVEKGVATFLPEEVKEHGIAARADVATGTAPITESAPDHFAETVAHKDV